MKFIFFIICSMFLFSGCASTYENYLKYNIAEVREFLLEGGNENVSASLICGKREKDYVINGFATETIEFGVLTFTVKNIDDYDESLANYVLLIGTTRYDGALLQNPFDKTLVVDIGKIIDKNEDIIAKLIIGDFSVEIEMTLINKEWKVNSNKVLKIVSNKYKEELESFVENGVFGAEVYIKILNDADIYKGDYYWYVNIVSKKGESISLIISPYTEEILASNINLNSI